MKPQKLLLLAFSLITTTALAGDINWKPSFNDKPVAQEKITKINAAMPQKAIVTPKTKRKVLIYSATSGYRHGSIPVGKIALEKLGMATNAYQAVVSDDPDNFSPESLQTFDSVILLSPTADFFMPPTHKKNSQRDKFTDQEWETLHKRHNKLVDNLISYVKNGGGLVGIHAATDACYNHKGYGETMGGFFSGHPWTSNMEVTINVEDSNNALIAPVFKDMKSFSLKDEIYQFKAVPYSRKNLRVLLHLDPAKSETPKNKPNRADGDYAVAWIQSVGKGRVFYTSLGHRDDIYWNPLMLNHYLAGIQFAVGDLAADTTPSAQLK